MASKAVRNSDGIVPESFINGDINSDGVTLYRLREGIERFFITDINNPAGSAMAQSAYSGRGHFVSPGDRGHLLRRESAAHYDAARPRATR